jgi:predicted HTH domain antitoxin
MRAQEKGARDTARALALAEQRLGEAAAELARREQALAALRAEREAADAQVGGSL